MKEKQGQGRTLRQKLAGADSDARERQTQPSALGSSEPRTLKALLRILLIRRPTHLLVMGKGGTHEAQGYTDTWMGNTCAQKCRWGRTALERGRQTA